MTSYDEPAAGDADQGSRLDVQLATLGHHDREIIELFIEFLRHIKTSPAVAKLLLARMDIVPDDEDLERWENEGGRAD